jgi:hypothetical protein
MRSAFFTDYNFRNEFALWLKHLGQARLELELRTIQARLGTPAERPEDLDSVQAIGHRMRGLLSLSLTGGKGIQPVSGGELSGSRANSRETSARRTESRWLRLAD